jgi:negative regulator of flagellin synthesis FlgM
LGKLLQYDTLYLTHGGRFMKITHNKVGQNLNTREAGRADKANGADKSGVAGKGEDMGSPISALAGEESSRVELSGRAQDMKKMADLAKAAPDVREDRIASLQKMIDEGKYKVDAKDIADKMVDEESTWF